MTPRELKNSILQLAIQGKLVEQRHEEGTAEELYRQIQAEKQRLVKEKKIKQEKPLPEITEDEKPFDIPDSWMWVHLCNIASHGLGKTLDKAKNTGNIQPYLCSINVYWDGIDLNKIKQAKFEDNELPKYMLRKGDLLICEGGDVGRSAVWIFDDIMYYQNALHRVRFYGDISPYFYKYLLELYKGLGLIDAYSKGMTIKHLVQSSLNEMWLPLPPLAEQKRIVAKIEELLPYIDRYEKAWSKLEDFNKRFPADMQKSMLQMAIQGNLVEQIPAEGTGEELYQQIQKEKEQLIKAKKIKKEKPLPEITEDEKPFDIPDSWMWVRVRDLGEVIGGGTPKTEIAEYWNDAKIPWLTPADMKFIIGKYAEHGNRNISEKGLESSSAQLMPKGSILYSSRAPIGYIALAANEVTTNQGFKSLVPFIMGINEYMYYCLIARTSDIISRASGTTFQEISGKDFGQTIIPLPPLAEQKRIVAKLEEILPLCDKLK